MEQVARRGTRLAHAFGVVLLLCLPARAQSVATYHATPDRNGVYVVPGLTWKQAASLHRDRAFDGRVFGRVYAQPVVWESPKTGQRLLIIATENDTVYALDANSGQAVWQRTLGRPVRRSALPCGNIAPLGITGTPVIDMGKDGVYLDAMVDAEDGGGPQHLVFGLKADDGATLPGFPLNVAQALNQRGLVFIARFQNQRGALALAEETLFVPYGGHFGDCGPYHGWVIGISIKDARTVGAWRTRGVGGGVWAAGGIAYDGRSLFVATGNTIGSDEWAGGEAIIRLGSDLKEPAGAKDFFAPTDWKMLDDRDADLGSSNPMPIDLQGAQTVLRLVLALGKDGKAYLLDRDNLGGIGRALAVEKVARGPIITAPVMYRADQGVLVALQGPGANCPYGSANSALTVLKIEARPSLRMSTTWCAESHGRGTPIVTVTEDGSNPIVWIAGAEGDNRLHGFRGDTGQPVFAGGDAGEEMPGLPRFASILVTAGRMFVAGDGRVYAFSP
jgi:hypothetical protein